MDTQWDFGIIVQNEDEIPHKDLEDVRYHPWCWVRAAISSISRC